LSARQQYRIVFKSRDGSGGTCFVDAANEAGALLFFAKAFPTSTVTSVKLEPVDPCSAYEVRPVQTSGGQS
jgi:hypothetical protein